MPKAVKLFGITWGLRPLIGLAWIFGGFIVLFMGLVDLSISREPPELADIPYFIFYVFYLSTIGQFSCWLWRDY